MAEVGISFSGEIPVDREVWLGMEVIAAIPDGRDIDSFVAMSSF